MVKVKSEKLDELTELGFQYNGTCFGYTTENKGIELGVLVYNRDFHDYQRGQIVFYASNDATTDGNNGNCAYVDETFELDIIMELFNKGFIEEN